MESVFPTVEQIHVAPLQAFRVDLSCQPTYPNTMKVIELIELLQNQDPDADAFVCSDYGDHCHTTQANYVREVRLSKLGTSGYSDSGLAVLDEDSKHFNEDRVEKEAVCLFS